MDTPSHRLPSLDQRVTQWKSEKTFTRGSLWNSPQLQETGLATRPSIEKRQAARSMDGAPEASSTGHLSVRDWRGGIRFSRRVSGLTMTSASWPSGEGIGL